MAYSADKTAGEVRYKETCINCHGPAGKGAGSFPKVSGKEISYTTSKLEAFPMAKPLTDEEIANLAAYLEDAKYSVQ